jgi:hypothetical protein
MAFSCNKFIEYITMFNTITHSTKNELKPTNKSIIIKQPKNKVIWFIGDDRFT